MVKIFPWLGNLIFPQIVKVTSTSIVVYLGGLIKGTTGVQSSSLVVCLASLLPDGITQDEEGNNRQRHNSINANIE